MVDLNYKDQHSTFAPPIHRINLRHPAFSRPPTREAARMRSVGDGFQAYEVAEQEWDKLKGNDLLVP